MKVHEEELILNSRDDEDNQSTNFTVDSIDVSSASTCNSMWEENLTFDDNRSKEKVIPYERIEALECENAVNLKRLEEYVLQEGK